MNKIVKKIRSDPDLRRRLREEFAAAGSPLSPQAIWAWKNLRRGVPPDRAVIVARVMGCHPHEIRPDIFPSFSTLSAST